MIPNLKQPRDPNTKSDLKVLREISEPNDQCCCNVGGGECNKPAVRVYDDEAGGEFYVCLQHLVYVEQLAQLINEMTPNQLTQMEDGIKQHED